MLRKPGDVDRSSFTAVTSRVGRKTNETNPDDEIRKLQKQPCNKKCADCSAKLPQAVNLTHGSFVCLVCAGIHREFNHRIKGIGHSSFTCDEVEFVATHGNDHVNSVYMYKYDASYDRMHAPDATYGDVDPILLRTWLRRKYVEKAWYKVDKSIDNKGRTHDLKETDSSIGNKATIVKLPPKASTVPTVNNSNDFFMDDNNVGGKAVVSSKDNSSIVATVNDSWDAFGSRGNQFDATFGTSVSPSVVLSNAHYQIPQDTIFHADFDNMNIPTNVVTTTCHQSTSAVNISTDLGNSMTHSNSIYHVQTSMPSDSSKFYQSSHLQPHENSSKTIVNNNHSIYGEVNHSHPVIIGASLQNIFGNNQSSETTPVVDPISAAFDTLVSSPGTGSVPMTETTFNGSMEVHEINSLLQQCTKSQLQNILQYIQQLLSQSKTSANMHTLSKKGNPFDF